MRKFIDKIKYSAFGRRFLKEDSALYQTLKRGKKFAKKVWLRLRHAGPAAEHYDDILAVFEECLEDDPGRFRAQAEQIDVIIPIYNGYEYLPQLFDDLLKTEMDCRYILVDDKSPDERVRRLEQEFADQHENVLLLKNDRNYGFVQTVNHGLSVSEHHVALINTDTELPEGWLERLMYPILHMDRVASSTPYTNSATIFSFPNFCYNNRIYRGLDVDTLDSYFRQLKPGYAAAPTGVGFCMGMNRAVIDEIGVLDYETFDRGFGEENDWCQRAIRAGYRNVQVENLFVWHKHGGSFPSAEKEKLIEQHMERLWRRYPSYNSQVASFVEKDPNRTRRRFVQMLIDTHEMKSILYFDHGIGGGATSYLNMKKQEFINQGACVSVIRYLIEENEYHFLFENDSLKLEYRFDHFSDVAEIGRRLHFDEVYINELVTYPALWDTQKMILELCRQQGCRPVMLMHDFFALCPTINLMGTQRRYCGMPETDVCEDCYHVHGYQREYDCESRRQWLLNWQTFLEACGEVRTFSEDTLRRVRAAFGGELCYTLVPHQVEYMFPVHKEHKTTDTLNIGLLGVLAIHKGGVFIRELLDEIQRRGVNVRIKLIGRTDAIDLSGYEALTVTGEYGVGELPRLVHENDIDLFLLSSVWPETFSYTTEEIIRMGMPVASFDLGAPADRVRRYEKGLILSGQEPGKVLDEMMDFAEHTLHVTEKRISRKKVIFLAEYISFSSRYRMDHMKEELLYQGVCGEVIETNRIPKRMEWDDVGAIMIYRCRYREPLKSFMEEALRRGVRIFYDIDDFIFDYDRIRDLPFMRDKEYADFETYSRGIYRCMEKADALLVSTDHLKLAAGEVFPDKPVMVNRNVASMELLILSVLAQRRKSRVSDRVVLGYFSGSHTHNRDFELISDILLEFMKAYDNVYLKIVGCLELPAEFQKMDDRVIRIDFVDWRDLPGEIATADINLMPLEQGFFHECKSENKWMEAALVKVPTIGSYTEEIAGVTKPGRDILLCRTDDEWISGLTRLVTDQAYREAMAGAAFDYVKQHKTTLSDHSELLRFMEI